MKDFSIIIPTLNEEGYIRGLLEDIVTQSIKPKEVFVVDGFSKDQTKKIVNEFTSVTLLSCPPNISSQRNYGAAKCSSRIIIFLDADTRLPSKDFCKKLITKFHKKNLDIACPYFLPHKSNVLIFSIYLFFNGMFFLFQKLSPSGAGTALVMKKSVWSKTKGFNPNIKFEDIELIRRTAKTFHFGMLPNFIWVSDRRFRKYGILKTSVQYILLSFFFLCNQFNYSPFAYTFGRYSKTKKNVNKIPRI